MPDRKRCRTVCRTEPVFAAFCSNRSSQRTRSEKTAGGGGPRITARPMCDCIFDRNYHRTVCHIVSVLAIFSALLFKQKLLKYAKRNKVAGGGGASICESPDDRCGTVLPTKISVGQFVVPGQFQWPSVKTEARKGRERAAASVRMARPHGTGGDVCCRSGLSPVVDIGTIAGR